MPTTDASRAPRAIRANNKSVKERRYSKDELLLLRDELPIVICNMKEMRDKSADLLRLPAKVMSDPNFKSCPTRALRRVPNFNGRDGNDSSEDHINRRKTTEESDDEEIVYRGHPIRHTLKETQWQFKRRDHSDRSSQPNSAPSGYHAQKAENFQKFYRAVVSPTHVRVTAGGRIVPNVRAPPQPIFVWNRDKLFFEAKPDKKSSDSIDTTWQEGAALKPSDPNQLHINGSGTNGNQPPVFNPQPLEKPLGSISSENLHHLPGAEQSPPAATLTNSGAQNSSVGAHPIKLSPPGQFDMTKPFMLNGHMVYPLPVNFQVPQGVSVLDIFGGNTVPQEHLQYPQHQPSPYQPSAFQSDIAPPQISATPMSPLVVAPAPQVLPIIPMMPAAAPAAIKNLDRRGRLSVIPPLPGLGYQSELMQPRLVRQQIQALQNEVKKFDHQLEHNRHQIDEAHVKKQRFYVQSQIQTLEASLALLPVDEPAFTQSFPGAPSRYSPAIPRFQPMPQPWTASPAYKSKSFDEPSKQSSFSCASSTREVRSESCANVAMGASDASGAVVSGKMSTVKAESAPRRRLSLSAAKAPPFKPRSQQALVHATTPLSMKANEKIAATEPVFDTREITNPKESVEDVEARLTFVADKWFKAKDETVLHSSMNSSTDGMPGVRVHDNFREDGLSTPASQRQGTGPFQVPGEDMMTPLTPHGTGRILPYLMGFPPPGTAFKEAKSHEFTYARPLTPEEIRARHLYWGNASKEALKGLPKFDGKDFYPPSPQKGSILPVNHSSSSETSTVVRKSNTSSATSKGVQSSEESGALIKISESDSSSKIVGQCNEKVDEKTHERDDKASVDSWGASKSVSTPPIPTQAIYAKIGRSPADHNTSSFLLGMLKNNPAVSSPLSGVSSAHAVGSLPNYGGAAVSSLAPGLMPRSSAAFDLPTGMIRRSTSKLSFENRPASQAASIVANVSTASELLSMIARQDEGRHGEIYPDSSSEAILAGPVVGSNW